MYSFSYLEPVCCSMSSSNYCFLTCIQVSQDAGQVVWYSHLLQNFPQFIVIHTVKGFGIVNKAEIDVFLKLSFSIIQWMLAIWSLVPLPFLKPAGTSGSSRFFFNESVLHISPSNEYSGLISFRIDWFNLLAIKETLKSLFQPYNSKASILQRSSLLYGPTLTSDSALSLCQVLGAEWARHCPYPQGCHKQVGKADILIREKAVRPGVSCRRGPGSGEIWGKRKKLCV